MHDILLRVCNKQKTARPVDAVAPEWFGGGHERRSAELKVVVFSCTGLCKCIAYAALKADLALTRAAAHSLIRTLCPTLTDVLCTLCRLHKAMPIAEIRGLVGTLQGGDARWR